MTDVKEIEKPTTKPAVKTQQAEPEVIQSNNQSEVALISLMAESLLKPLMQTREIEADHATQRAQISANIANKIITNVSILVLAILVIAGYALYEGNPNLAEKIIIAIVGFLGGFGLGKGNQSKN